MSCPSASSCSSRDPVCLGRLAQPHLEPIHSSSTPWAASSKGNRLSLAVRRPNPYTFRSSTTKGNLADSGWIRPVVFLGWRSRRQNRCLDVAPQPDGHATEHRQRTNGECSLSGGPFREMRCTTNKHHWLISANKVSCIAVALPRATGVLKSYLMPHISTCGLALISSQLRIFRSLKIGLQNPRTIAPRASLLTKPCEAAEHRTNSIVVPKEQCVKNATPASDNETNQTTCDTETIHNRHPNEGGYTPMKRQNRCTALVGRLGAEGVEHKLLCVTCTGARVCRALCTTSAVNAHGRTRTPREVREHVLRVLLERCISVSPCFLRAKITPQKFASKPTFFNTRTSVLSTTQYSCPRFHRQQTSTAASQLKISVLVAITAAQLYLRTCNVLSVCVIVLVV